MCAQVPCVANNLRIQSVLASVLVLTSACFTVTAHACCVEKLYSGAGNTPKIINCVLNIRTSIYGSVVS